MNTQYTLVFTMLLLGLVLKTSAMEKSNEYNLEVDSILFIEEDEAASFDFDTATYLPVDFNPYAAPSDFRHVSYIEEKAAIDLGFDTKEYLPEGFDPYRFFFDIHSIEYIEDEELLDLDLAIIKQVPTSGLMLPYEKEIRMGS
ncbi:hypothetical protein SAMN06265375_10520 [Muriicola jejuensis]|uniref:Uncharacterized protein n=1 Tax=Muriicola jejuensis TaxID=504488 RepID=A0A6P0UEM8_9FLAO|nr:hypothetical protein [Muriicola jejuensis]NER11731.1 hypothetical protein [Muriicola jejuensis]SMP25038.1 hypothetical protein SAMN06265375_10520 [Muriicola jejuensis]